MRKKRTKDQLKSGVVSDGLPAPGPGRVPLSVRKQLNLEDDMDDSVEANMVNDSGIFSSDSSLTGTPKSKQNGSYLDFTLAPRLGGLYASASVDDKFSDTDSGVSSEHDSARGEHAPWKLPDLREEEFSDTGEGIDEICERGSDGWVRERSGTTGVDVPAILCLLVLLVVLILSFVTLPRVPTVHYEQTEDELHVFLGQHFFLKIFGLLSAVLVAVLVGIGCCWFSWAVTLQDSAVPQQLPASPISPTPLRVKSGKSYHLAYILSLLNGLSMFCYALWWQRNKYLP